MGCLAVPGQTELEFIQSLRDRSEHNNHCAGPLVRLSFSPYRLSTIEEAFGSEVAHDLLWSGYLPHILDTAAFELCAVHWMDLACLVLARSALADATHWRFGGELILNQLFHKTGWDPREISNLLAWQRTYLT